MTIQQPARHPLRNRNFVLLLGGQVVSFVGDQIQNLALPLVVLLVTGSATQAGLLLGLQTAAYLGFGIVAGALADRWNRRITMICCDLGRALLAASVPVALYFGVLGIGQLIGIAVVSGMLATLFESANSAALPNVVEQAQLPSALGLSEGAFSAVGIVGASIAGALYAAGQLVPFLVNAASFLVSVVTLVFLRTEFQAERSEKPARLVAEIGEGLAWVWREPLIRFLAFVQAADNLRYGAGYLLIIVLAQRLGSTPVQIGLIFSGAAIGGLAGSVLSGWATRRFRVGRIAVFMLWIEALAFPFYSVAPSWTVLGAIALVESVLSPIYSVAIGTYRLSRTPDALRGRVGGAVSTVTTGTLSIGAIVGGILLSAIGPVALALACGGWLVLLALATTLNRQIRTATASGSSA